MPQAPNSYRPSIPDDLDPRTKEMFRQIFDRLNYLLDLERERQLNPQIPEASPTRWNTPAANDPVMSGTLFPGIELPSRNRGKVR